MAYMEEGILKSGNHLAEMLAEKTTNTLMRSRFCFEAGKELFSKKIQLEK